jgi:hypothetical protein
MSYLVDFYRGQAPDSQGRFLHELWDWDDDDLEVCDDFIQWMFPLTEPSHFNPDAPLLNDEEIAVFRSDADLRSNLRRSFERILRFLGLSMTETGQVREGANFTDRIPDVWAYPNHNWLRITRILKSLILLGLESEARALFDRLESLYSQRKFPLTAETFAYWSRAIDDGHLIDNNREPEAENTNSH